MGKRERVSECEERREKERVAGTGRREQKKNAPVEQLLRDSARRRYVICVRI